MAALPAKLIPNAKTPPATPVNGSHFRQKPSPLKPIQSALPTDLNHTRNRTYFPMLTQEQPRVRTY
jgi:hypothetical protein